MPCAHLQLLHGVRVQQHAVARRKGLHCSGAQQQLVQVELAQVDCTGGVRLDDDCWRTHYVLFRMRSQGGESGILTDGIMIGWVRTGGFIIDGSNSTRSSWPF